MATAAEMAGWSDEQLINEVVRYHAGTGAQTEIERRLMVSMNSSSKRLERLTWVLVGLTLVLVALTIALVLDG